MDENAEGEPTGIAADQFALAVVAYELLTGRVPFSAETTLAGAGAPAEAIATAANDASRAGCISRGGAGQRFGEDA